MPKPMDYQTLRAVAEWASGVRGRDLWFVVKNGREIHVSDRKPGDLTDDDQVIFVKSQGRNPGLPRVKWAHISSNPDGSHPVDLMNLPNGKGAADAVFWTASAVEKFMVPYYASVAGNHAADEIRKLLTAFDDNPDTPRTDDAAIAMVHIPKSEYAEATSTESLADHIGVVFQRGSAPTSMLMLREYLDQAG